MNTETPPDLSSLEPKLNRLFEMAGAKVSAIDRAWDPADGTPVFTVEGRYTTRGWTEWTQGFLYGCAILHYDATGDEASLTIGRGHTLSRMAGHLTHTGVHDHGFNNLSTYGNLRRLAREGRTSDSEDRVDYYELAIKVSGAVQASRWTSILGEEGVRDTGFVHSFNGPHSLFSDTIRSMRIVALADRLGHKLVGENDEKIDLLKRSIQHALATARYNVYYGDGRDAYDTPEESGRVVHESIFNVTDGRYRCPSTQQGYAPFSTWTRGLAWILCGYAEQLEFLETVVGSRVAEAAGMGKDKLVAVYRRAAEATAEWYLGHSFTDGMVYWDAGAPGIGQADYARAVSDPYNDHEPIDSSAAAIAGQGFLRLGNWLAARGETEAGERYRASARKIADTLFAEPYLSTDPQHQGLILHSIYHRPNGWDHIAPGQTVPNGESSLWGDYHALELGLMLLREAQGGPYITFWG
ncbi:MAG: glycosyl hydrolase [Planctomycetota bacterium]|jgi:hypothetical protein